MFNLDLRIKLFFVFFMFMSGFLFTFFINPVSGWSALLFEGQLFEGERLITAGETVAITLRLYDDEFDGNLLFEENQEIEAGTKFSCVTFEKGEVTVKKRFAGVPAEKLWVEIECSGLVMTPRLSLSELGSLNKLTAKNNSIKEAHLRTSGSATLVIDNNGVHLGATLDMAGEAINLGGNSRTTWPSGGSSSDLETRVAALETLLHHFSRSGNDITISGANLYVNNGTNSTYGTPNNLGNLIIGYNESRDSGEGADDRSGSHNFILGRKNNYSSYGGLVAGYLNTISGHYASVTGGDHNVASGNFSSISGGYKNTATGEDATVSGGYQNTATGESSSISGGSTNTTAGQYSSIAGGSLNSASGENSSVFGGYNGGASAVHATVSGGVSNFAKKPFSSVFGGEWNTANGDKCSILGGGWNYANAESSCILGGYTNMTSGSSKYGCVSGGQENVSYGEYSSISGGCKNSSSGKHGSVLGGNKNNAYGPYSCVSGGYKNTASGESSSVYGGDNETASGTYNYKP